MVTYHVALEGSRKYICSRCHSGLTKLWANEAKGFVLAEFSSVGLVLHNSDRCAFCRLTAHCLGLGKLEIPSSVSQNIDLFEAEILMRWMGPRGTTTCNDQLRPVTIEFELFASSSSTYYTRLSPCHIKIRGDDLGRLGIPKTFGGRPPMPTQAQLPLIKKWLSGCPEEHGSQCDVSLFRSSPSRSLMVIDVKRGCLVDLSPSPSRRYFALSYVWGQAAAFETVLDNVDSLRRIGGINAVRHLLPKTITDAMDLLLALDEQYLWCDRLCIVQDDARNKHSLISRMDEVYASAFAVILARSGSNAEAGLFNDRHPWHTEERISDNLRLIAIPIPNREEQYDGTAPLEGRGWTFQEKLLARRQIIFDHGLASFECERSTYYAAFSNSEESRQTISSSPTRAADYENGNATYTYTRPPSDGSYARLLLWCKIHYYDCLREYTRRALSFPSDSINAFQGILQCFASLLRTEINYGLPAAFFDSAMIWTTTEHESICCDTFPTWCWAPWSGVKISRFFDEELFRFWVVWYCDDMTEGIIRAVRRGVDYWRRGELEASSSSTRDTREDDDATWSRSRLSSEFQRYCRVSAGLLTRRIIPSHHPSPSPTSIPLKPGTLRFNTLCASFDFSSCSEPYFSTTPQRPNPASGHVQDTSHYYIFRDKYGIPCGAFYSDTNRADCPDNLKGGKQDLVVLAETAEVLDLHALIEERAYIERLKTQKGVECKPSGAAETDSFGMFVAIVVQWVGGVAYRKSSQVVFICRVAMENALGDGAAWREVVLR